MFTILFVDLFEWFLDQYANIVSAYIVYPIQKIYLKKSLQSQIMLYHNNDGYDDKKMLFINIIFIINPNLK